MKTTTLSTLLLTVMLTTTLTGCGFALRGYNTPAIVSSAPVNISMGSKLEDFEVKKALKNQFTQLGITVNDKSPVLETKPTSTPIKPLATPSIQVSNIQLQTYQLRGLLTEIRLVLSADVRYKVIQDGKPVEVTNNVQVQRSYQYDLASVNTDNPQAEQIKLWLYENLAQRISDQYMALILPAAQVKK